MSNEAHPPVDQTLPDKGYLYGRYQDEEDARLKENRERRAKQDRLALRLAHKSLDIPEEGDADDMDVRVDNRRYGAGLKEIALAGLLGAGLLGGGAGLFALLRPSTPSTPPPAVGEDKPTPSPSEGAGDGGTDTDTRYRLEFSDD